MKPPLRPVNDNSTDAEQPERPHDAGLRVTELAFPARFLLWGMRTWLMAWRQAGESRHGPGEAYRRLAGEGFLQAGVPQAMDCIDSVFQALAAAALRPIDLRCPPCPHLSADEALLLGAVAAGQRQQHGIAWAALCLLLPPAVAQGALPSLVALALHLRKAELMLSPLDPIACDAPELGRAMQAAGAAAAIH